MIEFSPDLGLLSSAAGAFFAGAFSPGPNNAICAAIAAAHGWRRAMPFVFGVAVGFPALLLVFSFGLGAAFSRSPELHLAVKIAGSLFLLHLAWRIAFAKTDRDENNPRAPAGFFRAVMFQWVNPKALAFCASMSAAYVRPEHLAGDALALTAMAVCISVPANTSWVVVGAAFSRVLTTPRRMRLFNIAMGALLALSVAGLFLV